MPFKPGESGTPNGRPRGSGVKEKIMAVYEACGGVQGMTEWAKANQTEFYKLYGRLIPTDIVIDAAPEVLEGLSTFAAFVAKASGQAEDGSGEGLGASGSLLPAPVSAATH